MNISNTNITIDRAVHELKSGRVIAIDKLAVWHPEFINENSFEQIKSNAKLVITNHRAFALGGEGFSENVEIGLAGLTFDELQILICGDNAGKKFEFKKNVDQAAKAAVELAKMAELLPTVIVIEGEIGDFKIKSQEIFDYIASDSAELKLVTEAPLNLADAEKAKILGFRSANGMDEHYAIIIGEPGPEPLVRIHSSCYTGDLLGSLSCDCGDQLRGAIRLMDENGGGIIIYLMQEGRGIGLINKLRAYKLQAGGLDTVQANEFLGFDDEERSFGSAAAILKQLKIERIRLVTNNPKKITGLESLGIAVTGRVPLIMSHDDNKAYLKVKSEKSGHIID